MTNNWPTCSCDTVGSINMGPVGCYSCSLVPNNDQALAASTSACKCLGALVFYFNYSTNTGNCGCNATSFNYLGNCVSCPTVNGPGTPNSATSCNCNSAYNFRI